MKTHPPLATARRGAAVAAVIGGVAALAAACGSQPATGHTGTSAKPASSLVISVAADHGATPRRWTLTCGPDGGTHPGAQAACAALASLSHPFAPPAAGVMCPMAAGGPQTATITGTWHGQKVSASYSRVNGCQTARWNKLEKVLGQVNPGGPMIPASGSPAAG
jgi:hypothetical protein